MLSGPRSRRLASVTGGSAAVSTVYDADGNRLIRKDGSGSTLYLPEGVEVHVDAAGSNATSTRYYSFAGETVAVRTGAGLSFLGSDRHGTAQVAVSSATGAATVRRSDPFGNPRGGSPSWPGERGFVGGTTDSATGLTHLGAREYDPTLGRFVSADPLLDASDPQQINGYAYADNNPTTSADPDGMLCTNGPDGMCRTPSGKNIPTPGVSEQGGRPSSGGGGSKSTTFDHGSGIHTTISGGHAYINDIQLPDGAPSSGRLAERMVRDLPKYRQMYEARYKQKLELTPDQVLILMGRSCRKLCSRDFEFSWLPNALTAVTDGASRGTVGVDHGSAVITLANIYLPITVALRIGDAVKSGAPDVTRVGRWMGKDEYNQMLKSGKVVEGGGGRTYVGITPSENDYPGGKGYYVEFDVPSGILRAASQPNWGVIPGPNVTTTRWGPAPRGMPPATNITMVTQR